MGNLSGPYIFEGMGYLSLHNVPVPNDRKREPGDEFTLWVLPLDPSGDMTASHSCKNLKAAQSTA